jgi:hypothetical protein
MYSAPNRNDRCPEVEAMILAAGQYVRPSDDLRPRVLELARSEAREQSGQRRVRRLALVGVIMSLAMSSGNSASRGRQPIEDVDALYRQAASKASCTGELGWGLAQAYADLRQRQSEKLRLQ